MDRDTRVMILAGIFGLTIMFGSLAWMLVSGPEPHKFQVPTTGLWPARRP